jgi:molybdopterin-guanine dinucleotide biosynthesis protein A
MGRDKASLPVGGQSLAEQIADEFDRAGVPVTVLGREPIAGRAFLRDSVDFGGPAAALSKFCPSSRVVFVCGCDLPAFRAECVAPVVEAAQGKEAAVPTIGGRGQYLCAAYDASVFQEWQGFVESGGVRSMRELVRVLDCAYLDEAWLSDHGLRPEWFKGANTPEELRAALETRNE